ncbi:hypothetical protein KXX53_000908, partial [Aspergillus fumigatus]
MATLLASYLISLPGRQWSTRTASRAFKSVDPSAKKQSAAQETHPVHYVAFNPL